VVIESLRDARPRSRFPADRAKCSFGHSLGVHIGSKITKHNGGFARVLSDLSLAQGGEVGRGSRRQALHRPGPDSALGRPAERVRSHR